MYENLLERSVIPFLYNYAKKYGFTIITYHNEFVITETHMMNTYKSWHC